MLGLLFEGRKHILHLAAGKVLEFPFLRGINRLPNLRRVGFAQALRILLITIV
jgi:hypothetical protein